MKRGWLCSEPKAPSCVLRWAQGIWGSQLSKPLLLTPELSFWLQGKLLVSKTALFPPKNTQAVQLSWSPTPAVDHCWIPSPSQLGSWGAASAEPGQLFMDEGGGSTRRGSSLHIWWFHWYLELAVSMLTGLIFRLYLHDVPSRQGTW